MRGSALIVAIVNQCEMERSTGLQRSLARRIGGSRRFTNVNSLPKYRFIDILL